MSTSNSKADSDRYIHVKFNIFGFSRCGLLLQKQIGPTSKQYSENTSPVCFNKICLIALQMSKGAILPDLGYNAVSAENILLQINPTKFSRPHNRICANVIN